jgi:hypothetical protein
LTIDNLQEGVNPNDVNDPDNIENLSCMSLLERKVVEFED